MATSPLSIVSSQPHASGQALSIVSSEPLPQEGLLSRAGHYITGSLSKTAENMSLEHPLAHIAAADRLLGQGDLRGAGDELKQLIPNLADWAKDTLSKVHSGDASGATANILPFLMMKGGPEAVESGSEALGGLKETAGTAVRGAVRGIKEAPRASHGVALGAGTLGHFVPGLGTYGGIGIAEAANLLYQGSKGAIKALGEASASKATSAEIAEMGARADTQAAQARASAPPAAASPSVAVAKPIDPVLSAPRRPGMQPSDVVVEPQAPEIASAATASPLTPEMLDGISQWAAKKPYAKLTTAEKAGVDTLAAKLETNAPPAETTPPTPPGHQYQTISPIVQKLINKERITMEDLGAPDPTAPKAPRAVEPDDYSSLLEQSIDEARTKTLGKRVADFARSKTVADTLRRKK